MELTAAQKKIIQGKPFGCYVLKGGNRTGKTTSAVHRMLYLKNNYCLYEEDGILVVGADKQNAEYIDELYTKAEVESSFQYYTLFSSIKDKIHITAVNDIVHKYFEDYCKSKKINYAIINDIERKEILEKCIVKFHEKDKKIKVIDNKYLSFLGEEISWIKACGYKSLEEYQEADRLGRKYTKEEGPQRLLKNSKERKAIYDVFLLYNKMLKENNLIDNEDLAEYALRQAKKKGAAQYAHVIIDESHKLTKVQLELIRVLCNDKAYSSMMLIMNTEDILSKSSNAWFVKGRKYNTFGMNTIGKTYSLKAKYVDELTAKIEELNPTADISIPQSTSVDLTSYENVLEAKTIEEILNDEINTNEQGAEDMSNIDITSSSVENFEYHDLRHFRKFDFIRDPDNIEEIIVKSESGDEDYTSEDLRELPVYSDIAAGEPILMNSELEANFYVPQYWLKGVNDCFILKVKGDSMKGANIHDGDYVVIRKQRTAQNSDIVAVDLEGSATLKRLSLGKGGATLMPENPKYSPIPLYDREATILGIAVGLIKSVQ